jgi:uncharacterized protein
MKNILIVGGTGFIGHALIKVLKAKNHKVSILTRKIDPSINLPQYLWDWENNLMDSLPFFDVIINLAGANINAKRWTKAYKTALYDSRVVATNFLFTSLKNANKLPHQYIASSATGFYGNNFSTKIMDENDAAGNDFLAKLCLDWEETAKIFEQFGVKTAIIRTSVVLSKNASTFKKLVFPIKLGLGAAIGTGNQFFSWIHVNDITGIYSFAIENELEGIFNACCPSCITNAEMTRCLAMQQKKPFWSIKIPAFVIKIIFGEFADALLFGNKISADKLQKVGYQFEYQDFTQFLQKDF